MRQVKALYDALLKQGGEYPESLSEEVKLAVFDLEEWLKKHKSFEYDGEIKVMHNGTIRFTGLDDADLDDIFRTIADETGSVTLHGHLEALVTKAIPEEAAKAA